MTLARSTGAVISVVGTADMNPAQASSAVDRRSVVRLGVSANISFLEASYAYPILGKRRNSNSV
jgi:hypothetical protein